MKVFTEEDIVRTIGSSRLAVTKEECVDRPLWGHKRGLGTGFGMKLTTSRGLMFKNSSGTRFRRIYVTCYSNCGTAWIVVNREQVIVW